MKGERVFFSVVSMGYCFAQAFPFDARSLLHKMLQAPRAPGTSSPLPCFPTAGICLPRAFWDQHCMGSA